MSCGNIIVFFYVDDFVVLFRDGQEAAYQSFHDALVCGYNVKVLGDLKWFIGMEVIRNRANKKLWLSQRSYIEKIAQRFVCLSTSRKLKQPLGPEPLEPFEGTAPSNDANLFQALIGSLLYATVITRADGAFIVASRAAAAEFATACWTRLVGNGFAPDPSVAAESPLADGARVTVFATPLPFPVSRRGGPWIARADEPSAANPRGIPIHDAAVLTTLS
ncbi:hypothetical protein G6O67_004379 [Ophiocordyceps sinensis]|uniref:Reverse transcriptase Ty1/copia-type domain-containing protein n=2 Tax=Ophiocordyceps sinensis TaxID=72228 RepID=A0A8H4LYI3_9HYPO|nr:Reverse transcriptase, RNA-dependent DNA polymerase [Ophiocordyceps sinensis CO18]KAF4507933.1 hypothetical protein G6O67_004379 [Ophiocordyceps sinensis]